MPLQDIRPQHLEKVLDRMRDANRSPRSMEYLTGTFRRIWKLAAKRRLVSPLENPAAHLDLPRYANARLRVLTVEELRAILEELAGRDVNAHDVTLFAALTGCRASEALGLLWQQVDLARKVAHFSETKNREVHLAPELLDMLKRRGPGEVGQHVFHKSSDGLPYEGPPSSFSTVVKALKLNEDRHPRDRVSFHSLRHSAATISARQGVPVKDLQIMYGWKTPAMVFRYAKGSEEVQRRAAHGLAKALMREPGKVVDIEEARRG